MPYHSPRHRDHDRDRDHSGVFAYGAWPIVPAWGYPYLPEYWDNWDSSDEQPSLDYSANQDNSGAQPAADYSDEAYDAPQERKYTPWPYSRPAPTESQPSALAAPEAPLTVVFKDGRPPEQIHNYLLTNATLSVLDQRRREIPVDQIDLVATAKLNHDAGIEFALPGGSR